MIKDHFYCRPIGDINVKGISHQLRTYEVVGDFKDLGPEQKIETEIGGFKVSLDPNSLDSETTQQAREALRTALAALDAQDDNESG